MLHLDAHHGHPTGVLDAVPCPERHVDGLAGLEALGPPVDDDARRALHHHPVLRATAMALEADAVTGIDSEAFHLVAATLDDVLESAPGTRLEAVGAGFPGGRTTSASG